jgi:hypothetical protein
VNLKWEVEGGVGLSKGRARPEKDQERPGQTWRLPRCMPCRGAWSMMLCVEMIRAPTRGVGTAQGRCASPPSFPLLGRGTALSGCRNLQARNPWKQPGFCDPAFSLLPASSSSSLPTKIALCLRGLPWALIDQQVPKEDGGKGEDESVDPPINLPYRAAQSRNNSAGD